MTEEEENLLWERGYLGDATSQSLLDTMVFYNGLYFALRSGREHHQLRRVSCQRELIESPGQRAYLRYVEDVSKNHPGGLKGRNMTPKVFLHHANTERPEHCFVQLFKWYTELCPKDAPHHTFHLRPAQCRLVFQGSTGPQYTVQAQNEPLPMCYCHQARRRRQAVSDGGHWTKTFRECSELQADIRHAAGSALRHLQLLKETSVFSQTQLPPPHRCPWAQCSSHCRARLTSYQPRCPLLPGFYLENFIRGGGGRGGSSVTIMKGGHDQMKSRCGFYSK